MALCLADSWRDATTTQQDSTPARIEIDATRRDALTQAFISQMGRAPDPEALGRLIDAEIDHEILYREALARGLLERDGGVQTRLIQKMLFLDGASEIENAGERVRKARELGLHRDDVVIRRILIQKMRLLGSALEERERPSREAIVARYAATRKIFREPDRLSFVHVFVSADERPGSALEDAQALRNRLRGESIQRDSAISLGDAFALGHRFAQRSERELARSFGSAFGAAALALSPGPWSMPIESAYGQHLVWVESREPGQIPSLDAVFKRIRLSLEQEFRDAKFRALLSDLRKRYEVVVIDAAGDLG